MAPFFVLRDDQGLIFCLVFPQSRPLPSARGEQLELELRVWQQLSPPTIDPTSYRPVAAILPTATYDSTSVKLTASEGQVCLSFYAPSNAHPSAGEVQHLTVRFHRYLPPLTASPSRGAAPRTFDTPTGLFAHGVKKTKASPTRSKAMQQSAGVSSLAKAARGKRSLQAAKKQAEVSLDEAKAQARKDKNKKKKAQKKGAAEAGAGPKRKSGVVGDASPGKRRRVESDDEDEDEEEGSFHTAQGTPDVGFALDAPDDQPPPIDDDQGAASSWDTPPTYGRRAQAHAETKRRRKTRVLATDAVLPLDEEDSSESDATRARVEERIASRRLPPPTAEPQRSNTRPIRTNSRVQADLDQQEKQRRLNIDEGLIEQLIPKMRATQTRGAIRAARHDAVPADWFRRSEIKHLTDEGVESMRKRATGGGRSSSGSLAAMDAMVLVEMRGHVILVKWKLLERYYRGRVSAIELRRYGCGLDDAEHARFYKARCRSFAPFFCRTREQFQQLHETQRHLDAHNCHTPGTYLIVVVFEDVAGRPQIALYVGSACEQSVAERQSQHDAKMLEMKEAEAAKDRRKMLALEAEQPGLCRRGVLDHWHFTLTQMAKGLVGAAAQARWLEKLAGKLVGKKLGRLGKTPLGLRQTVRMVTAVDELIGAALFASVKGIGFPTVTELNGARYSSKRGYYEKANAVVPAIGFADLRWQALGTTPHLAFVAPHEPPKLPRSEWTKRAMQRFNILSHGSTVSSPAMSHLASSPVTASLPSPLVARLLNASATPAASVASQHVQDALVAAGIDANDPTLIDMIDEREVEEGCAASACTRWPLRQRSGAGSRQEGQEGKEDETPG